MIRQQAWTKTEAAVLLDALLRVNNNQVSRTEAIREVSSRLRAMAKKSGLDIDETYRNIAGITFQLKSMESAYCGYTIMKPASKLFQDTVHLYRNNPKEFYKLLKEAVSTMNTTQINEDSFWQWMSKRITPVQLSELFAEYKELESYGIQNCLLRGKLFEDPDSFRAIELMKNIHTKSYTQKFFKRKQYSLWSLFLEHYIEYLGLPEHSDANSTMQPPNPAANITASCDSTSDFSADRKDAFIRWQMSKGKMRTAASSMASSVASASTAAINYGCINKPIYAMTFGKAIDACESLIKNISYTDKVYQENKNNKSRFVSALRCYLEFAWYEYNSEGDPYEKEEESEGIDVSSAPGKEPRVDFDSSGLVKIKPEDVASSGSIQTTSTVVAAHSSEAPEVEVAETESVSPVTSHFSKAASIVADILNEASIPFKQPAENYFLVPCQEKYLNTMHALNGRNKNKFGIKSITIIRRAGDQRDLWRIRLDEDFDSTFGQDSKILTASLEERVKEALYQECAKNRFGTTVAYLKEEARGVSNKQIKEILVAAKWAKYENGTWKYVDLANDHPKDMVTAPEMQCHGVNLEEPTVHTLDWSRNELLTGTTPVSVSYFGTEDTQITSWVELYLSVVSTIYEDYDYHFEGDMAFAENDKHDSLDFVSASLMSGLRMPKAVIVPGLETRYLETDLDIAAILQRIQFILDLCNVDYENLEVRYIKEPEHGSSRVSSIKVAVKKDAVSLDTALRDQIDTILREYFEDGFRYEKAIDRNRFKMYYSDHFNCSLDLEDTALVDSIKMVGTILDDRIFVKDESAQINLINEITQAIAETFDSGASCIYLEQLYNRFQGTLVEKLHIYNAESLESLLFSGERRRFLKRYNYLYIYNRHPDYYADVLNYMKKQHHPVSYAEIENALWYIPLDKIKNALFNTSGLVNVATEAYLFAENLPVNTTELRTVSELIQNALLQRNYISDVDLVQQIELHCPSILINTSEYPLWGLRNALAYLLKDQYSFRGAIISAHGEEISMAEVFADFAKRNERFRIEELRDFAKELNVIIYWDAVYGETIRISQDEFVRNDQISFDVNQIDLVLDNLIQDEYLPIKAVGLYLHFPAISVKWNDYILESYVANHSNKYRLIHASFSATDCCGAIVRKDSKINDYRALIVDVLSKSNSWKTKRDALQHLVDFGYQQRRIYSDIESVMEEAKGKMMAMKP